MSDKPRVLVVEDDLKVVQGLIRGLTRAGFDVSVSMDGAEGAQRVLSEPFDLVVLDLMLPGRTGFEVLEAMSGRVSIPVVVLSALTELPARLKSFDLGAVDFVPKPFWMEELVARLQSRLALRREGPRRTTEVGGVILDLDARLASRAGEDLGLTAHEFNALVYLVERPRRAITRRQLAEGALSQEGEVLDRTVDSHISRVRKKLGDEGLRIRTVWGIGYRYEPGEDR
ncbi:MAG: response regulator transcription factor [Deltaproteobacteria bacterium]|nr:response regulator transcription factor [Deltaproteobacteria bacterium]